MEKKLNHLMTYEAYVAEEFNPLKREDWKKAGTAVRKGAGFLTPEEEVEEGKKFVFNHITRKQAYKKFLKEDPDKAKKYLQFWGKVQGERNATPVWLKDKRVWIDRSYRYSPSGTIGAGN